MVLGNKLCLWGIILGLAVIFTGCADNPGKWPLPKLEAKISENLELTSIELAPRPEGGYQGSGQRADGETVKFTITQDPEAHRIEWQAQGDRGFVEDGYYELK